MRIVFDELFLQKPFLQAVLFGQIAFKILKSYQFKGLIAEHPYNMSFITNPDVLNFFKPLDLLNRYDHKNDR